MPVPVVPPRAFAWADLAAQAPDLAARVRARLEAAPRHVLATRTGSGGARVSGTGVAWHDGSLVLVGVREAAAADLLADPRATLHSNPGDGSRRAGDAMLQGRVVPGPGASDGARLQLTAVRLTTAVPDGLRHETWRGRGTVEDVLDRVRSTA